MELWSKSIQHSKFVKLLSKFSPTQTAQFHFAEVTSFISHYAKLCMLDIYMRFYFFWKIFISEILGLFRKLCKIFEFTLDKNSKFISQFFGSKFVPKTHLLCKLDIFCRPRSKVHNNFWGVLKPMGAFDSQIMGPHSATDLVLGSLFCQCTHLGALC
jgi:hypothetical protein